jgi:uncharacterized protein (TIGR03382 family)
MGITSPADGATVAPGFAVTATAMDNIGVKQGQLFIDDQPVTTTPGAGPYNFPTDSTLALGMHKISVEVTDGHTPVRQSINVNVALGGGNGSGSGSGSGSGDGNGNGNGNGGNGGDDGGVLGGCNSGGHPIGLALGLFVLAHILIRRRRYE